MEMVDEGLDVVVIAFIVGWAGGAEGLAATAIAGGGGGILGGFLFLIIGIIPAEPSAARRGRAWGTPRP